LSSFLKVSETSLNFVRADQNNGVKGPPYFGQRGLLDFQHRVLNPRPTPQLVEIGCDEYSATEHHTPYMQVSEKILTERPYQTPKKLVMLVPSF